MSVGYRSILHLDEQVDAIDVAEGQLRGSSQFGV